MFVLFTFDVDQETYLFHSLGPCILVRSYTYTNLSHRRILHRLNMG